ncbi:transcriptional regulator [Flavobacterium jejuense]|uniref:Transcriptional regulator n=1 Tax=Flavobacterium jejuense TaxID=1544455 RepID=A0ABX0IQN4_9FLAO|nr:transcriptional regulator [Flavobacterium jejuense]NHN24150.1 transcriptional regulator [Flavobacterium jejuense]
MNYIKHLTGFFEKVTTDYDLNPTHISLYMAIFQLWNQNRFQNPISISRDELMRISKISSTATYHKCIKELQEREYIQYNPSFNPFKGSTLNVLSLDFYTKPLVKKDIKNFINKEATLLKNSLVNEQLNEQALNKHQTSTKHVPYINNTNTINLANEQIQKNEKLNLKIEEDTNEKETQKKLREKKVIAELGRSGTKQQSIPPDKNEVITYFHEKNAPEIEAEKFYNHFESNGWLVGGKTKMKDWKAAIRNWLLNSQNFNKRPTQNFVGTQKPQPHHLQTATHKNYGEPL